MQATDTIQGVLPHSAALRYPTALTSVRSSDSWRVRKRDNGESGGVPVEFREGNHKAVGDDRLGEARDPEADTSPAALPAPAGLVNRSGPRRLDTLTPPLSEIRR